MIDTHCHIDLYPDPSQVVRDSIAAGVSVIVVTNLPSAFERAYPFVGNVRGIKLALGLHPLLTEFHADERERFREHVERTHYIGEVGLDFSPQGLKTKDVQLETFRFVLRTLKGSPRFVTLHSRRAESAVLQALRDEEYSSPVVFHWFSGSVKMLETVLAEGHLVSVNPMMVASPNGRCIIKHLPRQRVLVETDGPFVKVGQRPAVPADVASVVDYLASVWSVSRGDAEKQLCTNFHQLRTDLGGLGSPAGCD